MFGLKDEEFFKFMDSCTKLTDELVIAKKAKKKLSRINEIWDGNLSEVMMIVLKQLDENGDRTDFDKLTHLLKDREDKIGDFKKSRNLIEGSDEAKLINLFESGQYKLCYGLLEGLKTTLNYEDIDLMGIWEDFSNGRGTSVLIPMNDDTLELSVGMNDDYDNPGISFLIIHGDEFDHCVKGYDHIANMLGIKSDAHTWFKERKTELKYTIYVPEKLDYDFCKSKILNFIFNYNN